MFLTSGSSAEKPALSAEYTDSSRATIATAPGAVMVTSESLTSVVPSALSLATLPRELAELLVSA